MKRLVILLMFILCPIFVFSQFADNIRTAQPRKTLGPHTIGDGLIQVQTRLIYNYLENFGDNQNFRHATVFRYGPFEHVDLNAVFNWDYRTNDKAYPSNLQLGFRVNLIEKKGYIPGIGAQWRALLNPPGDRVERANVGSKFGIGVVQQVVPKVNAITHLSITWSGNGAAPTTDYGLGLVYVFVPGMTVFAEIVGLLPLTDATPDFTTNFNTGLTYRLKTNWNLDVSFGINDTEAQSWSVVLGTAFRFSVKDPIPIPGK